MTTTAQETGEAEDFLSGDELAAIALAQAEISGCATVRRPGGWLWAFPLPGSM
jgi:hypothetical protein